MRANAGHSTDDPGLFALDLLLHLLGADADLEQLRRWSGHRRVGVSEMLLCANEADLAARCVRCGWKRLSKLALPGIAALRGGGFLLLGRVTGDKAVVLLPGASRPTLVARAELEAAWDGRLVVMRKRRPTAILLRRLWRNAALRMSEALDGSRQESAGLPGLRWPREPYRRAPPAVRRSSYLRIMPDGSAGRSPGSMLTATAAPTNSPFCRRLWKSSRRPPPRSDARSASASLRSS